MRGKHYLFVLLAAIWFTVHLRARASQWSGASVERPNIILILADDMGQGDFGCYNPGTKIPTPHIDRLAAEGMRFTDAHSGSSACSPTRYHLLTGRYAWRTRLKRFVLEPYDPPLIEKDRLTLPALLKQHGYATACIGKWHLGWDWPRTGPAQEPGFKQPVGGGPTTRGFDHFFGPDVPNYPPYCFIENDRPIGRFTAQRVVSNLDGQAGAMTEGWRAEDILPTITRRAVEYLEERAKGREPFFLYFSLTSPHQPIAPSERFRGRSGLGVLGDFIMETDWAAGEVLATVERLNLAANSLVIFTADNGPAGHHRNEMIRAGQRRNLDWRAAKGSIYEGGHRVPFIARWPGRIPKGNTNDAMVCLGDMMATMASLLRTRLPADTAEDSFDILPALLGEVAAKPVRPTLVHHDAAGVLAIREGSWKLIPPQTPPPAPNGAAKSVQGELYNLGRDPTESTNLYANEPVIVARLAALLDQFKAEGRSRP